MRTGGPGGSAGPARSASRARWWGHLWWLLVGALVGVGIVSILTIGAGLLLLALVLVLVALRVPSVWNRTVASAVAGVGLTSLWLAWLNREGPGTVCHATATGSTCAERWNPWPFVAVGAVLAGLSIALARLLAGRSGG